MAMTSRIDQIGQNENDSAQYNQNPTTISKSRQAIIDTGICGDGKPCGDPYHCYGCPNDPQQTALNNQTSTENGFHDEKTEYKNQFEQPLDMVNHPAHYQSENGIECIEAIRAQMNCDQFAAYCQGNVVKYLWRWREKGGVESLKKAKWYLYRMIAEIEDE